jgi:hypothetical protein
MSAIPAAHPLSRRDKRREEMLDDVVSGCSYACLAEKQKISVRTARRLDTAESVVRGLVPGI